MNLQTIPYDHLVRSVAGLEKHYGGNCTHSPIGVPLPGRNFIQATGGNLQYFSVDEFSVGDEAPVVVAVGANYSQGANQLPNDSPSGLIGKGNPFVEADLAKWRKPLERLFEVYQSGVYSERWRPSARADPPLAMSSVLSVKLPGPFHFVMANFTPWITTVAWSMIRDKSSTHCKMILDNPPHAGSRFAHSERLKTILPKGTLWIGHGNYDVHDLFMQLAGHLQLEQWLFCSNLTFAIPLLAQMIKAV